MELTPDLLVDPGVLQAAGVSRAVGPVSVPRLLDLKTIAWSEASKLYGMCKKRAVDTREAKVPKVYEAQARAIDVLFDVTPGESGGMLSALKGYGGCVGIAFGWFGEGSPNVHHLIRFASQALADRCWMDWWASPEDAQAHFKAELFRDWGFAAARARAEALIEALPGSTFGKKTQARESLSRKDQENMIARSNRAFQTGTGPDPYPSPAPPRAAEGVSGWRS